MSTQVQERQELRINNAGSEWVFDTYPSPNVPDRAVWLHIFMGPVSGGLHMTCDEARDLARMLCNAANESESE